MAWDHHSLPPLRHWGPHVAVGLLAALLACGILGDRPALALPRAAAVVGITSGAWFFLLSDSGARRRATAVAALVIGLALAAMTYSVHTRYGDDAWLYGAGYALSPAGFLFFYISLSYFQAWNESRRWRFDYGRLADFAWNNILRAVLACVFLGLVWMVLGLWMALFQAIGIDFFRRLFTDRWFAYGISGASLGLAISLQMGWMEAVVKLRSLLFVLFRVLSVALMAMTVAFLVAVAIGGWHALWDARLTKGLMIMLILMALLLANSVIGARDDDLPDNPRHILRLAAMGLAASLPPLAVLGGLGLARTIGAHGLTPDRFHGAIAFLFALLYGVGYVGALVLRRGAWPAGMRHVNLALAPLVALVSFLLTTPVLNAEAWSVRNQVARLMGGKVALEDFDFAFLKFHAGKAGARALDDLLRRTDYPHYPALVQAIEAVKRQDYPMARARAHKLARPPVTLGHALAAGQVAIRPEGASLPQGLADGRYYNLDVESCAQGTAEAPTCFLLLTKLWGSRGQALFVSFRRQPDGHESAALHMLAEHERSGWRGNAGTRLILNDDVAALRQALLAGDIGVLPLHVQRLRIGKRAFEPIIVDGLRAAPAP